MSRDPNVRAFVRDKTEYNFLGFPKIGGGDIALISEWDTFYGQTLPKTVEQQFRLAHENYRPRMNLPDNDWVHKLTYLRGLDGVLPYAETKDQKLNQASNSGEKQPGATDFFKLANDTESLERPIAEHSGLHRSVLKTELPAKQMLTGKFPPLASSEATYSTNC